MSPENEQKLYTDFPLLYRDAIAGKRMSYGFECGDGWFNLIYNLSSAIEREALKLGVEQKSKKWPTALQVKEKFGTLRFYCAVGKRNSDGRGMLPSIYALIEDAGEKSAMVCQLCGRSAKWYQDGYLRTLCHSCEASYAARRNQMQSGDN